MATTRIHRPSPVSVIYRGIKGSKKAALLRALLKKSVLWLNARHEKKQAINLCARLQIPPERLPELFHGKKYGHEIVQELEAMAEMANRANLAPIQTKQIFKNSRTFEQARNALEQMAQAA
jgi:hypothetical protein|tara:strand:+ start:346 stop:708 length:363 start_codon:yes stop_codon:yes gene_type:complete